MEPPTPAPPAARSVAVQAPPVLPSVGTRAGLDRSRYAWLGEPVAGTPLAVETLEQRFPAPAGYARADLEPGGFGSWLRGLPLAAVKSPVRTFREEVLRDADDPRISGIIAIDVGRADLQQCADAVIRLHAEWRWASGLRDHRYRAAAGVDLPWSRFAAGERVKVEGGRLRWRAGGRPGGDYRTFRGYLDMVFAWANTVSLERQAARVSGEVVAPGDFFVLGGSPGHAVLVLDLATDRAGRRVALLGQGFMPAQSLHVLRAGSGSAWFELDLARDVETPFWRPFPWSALRRFLDPMSSTGPVRDG